MIVWAHFWYDAPMLGNICVWEHFLLIMAFAGKHLHGNILSGHDVSEEILGNFCL